jgi:hypothetical protein
VNKAVALDFLSPGDLAAGFGTSNTILDPHSVLIDEAVAVGKNNIFYPNVVIETKASGAITIGDNNTFYPGVYVVCSAGAVVIGNNNEFGPAGVTIKANMPDTKITIGSGGRYSDGTSIMGETHLGDGSQILGNITVQSCTLANGDTFRQPDPDKRAAVLKGFGLARGIDLAAGQVVNGAGNFADAPVEWQRAYHPKK